MGCNYAWYSDLRKSLVLTTSAFLLFSICTVVKSEAAGVIDNSDVKNKGFNQNNLKSYVIKYSADGGFAGRHDYVWYNSTTNHLLSNQKINTSLYKLGLSNALFDTQLSATQQKNLNQILLNGNFFNISFNNDKPDCCDISYYNLEIKMGNRMNSFRWTSGNVGDDPYYEKLPPIILKIIDTLEQYTTNSTFIFSESRIKDKFEIKREIIYEANMLLAQKNYTQADLMYNKALEIDSNDVDALVYKAHSLMGLGQLQDANLLIDKALNIQEDIYTLIAKATILIEMGQGQEALGWIDRALELDPNNAKALEMKSEVSDIIK